MNVAITENAIFFNEEILDLPVTLTRLTEILGKHDRVFKGDNAVYTWDQAGIFVHSENGELVEALNLKLNTGEDYQFMPNSIFNGEFLVAGDSYKKRTLSIEYKIVGTDQLGKYLFHYGLDGEVLTSVCITLVEELEHEEVKSVKDPDRYAYQKIEGEILTFSDFNFKLAVIEILMYQKKLLEPVFDVHGFVDRYTKREIDIEEEGYSIIPEVKEYFEMLEISKDLAVQITSIEQDGGDEIYGQLYPFWDGEDDVFNIKSAKDAALFPGLKKVVLFYDEDSTVLDELKEMGIAVEYL